MADDHDATSPGRRRFLTIAAGAGACAIGAAVGVPAAAFVAAPISAPGGAGAWVKTIRVDQLHEGEPKRVAIVADRRDAWTIEKDVELGSVWLVKRGDAIHAFSAVCPHLGCSVNATPEGSFACPCHTSAFDPDGKKKSGPSPRDLDALATRVEDGVVAVDFKRFRIGVPEKVQA